MSDSTSHEASRRTVIKGGAVGAGALLGALGLGAGTAAAAPVAAPAAPISPAAVAPLDRNVSYFLKLDGIAGESTIKGLEGWIELHSFSWGASNASVGAGTGGGTSGRATELETTFTAPTSKASPLLFRDVVLGTRIKSGAVVAVRQQRGRPPAMFLKYEFSDVALSFYKEDMADGSRPMDSGGLSFLKVEFSYYPTNVDGRLGEPVSFAFDFRTGKA